MGSALIHADGETETDGHEIVTGTFLYYANALKTSHGNGIGTTHSTNGRKKKKEMIYDC
jgi:hypothetical protein